MYQVRLVEANRGPTTEVWNTIYNIYIYVYTLPRESPHLINILYLYMCNKWIKTQVLYILCKYIYWLTLIYTSSHDKTRLYLRGVQIYFSQIKYRQALESGLFPLSQHPINTYLENSVPLVLEILLLPRW